MRNTVLICLLLVGCQKVPLLPSLSPHKIDIQQGNYVSQEMVGKLKLGMTRSQVRFVLGTPLVVDIFHADRWDYVYLYQKAGEVTEHRRIRVLFDGDKLARIEGDVQAAAGTAANADSTAVSSSARSPVEASKDAQTARPAPAAPTQ